MCEKKDAESVLYTRQILSRTPVSPVENRNSNFGNFAGRFENFAIKGLYRPYGNLPIPIWITNLTVTTIVRLLFHSPQIIGELSFFSGFSCTIMETVYWNKATKKRNSYRQFLPRGFIHMPKRLGYNITACRTKWRYTKLLSRLNKGSMHADIDFVGSVGRPALEARFDIDFTDSEVAELSSVIPFFVAKRCEASYNFTAPITGWLSENYFRDFVFPIEESVCFYDYRKAYCGHTTKRIFMTAFGRQNDKILSFQLNSSVAPDSYKYNDNLIFYGGEITPLPPVKITMPYGIEKKWNIQDTEGMIDLIFTPFSVLNRQILRSSYNIVYGAFDGTILTKSGKRLKLQTYSGIARRANLKILG